MHPTVKVIAPLAFPETVNVSFLSALSFVPIEARIVEETVGVNELAVAVILVWVKTLPTPATSSEIVLIVWPAVNPVMVITTVLRSI